MTKEQTTHRVNARAWRDQIAPLIALCKTVNYPRGSAYKFAKCCGLRYQTVFMWITTDRLPQKLQREQVLRATAKKEWWT